MSVNGKRICISVVQQFCNADVCMLNIYWNDALFVSSFFFTEGIPLCCC